MMTRLGLEWVGGVAVHLISLLSEELAAAVIDVIAVHQAAAHQVALFLTLLFGFLSCQRVGRRRLIAGDNG